MFNITRRIEAREKVSLCRAIVCAMKTSLGYIRQDGQVLMLYRNKKNADPNAGKWVGVGGKFLEDEEPLACMRREAAEETGWDIADWEYRGLIRFVNDLCPSEDMYLFEAFTDLPKGPDGALPVPETEEGTFAWIPEGELRDLPMWEGDWTFLAKLLAGERNLDVTLIYHGDELMRVEHGVQ